MEELREDAGPEGLADLVRRANELAARDKEREDLREVLEMFRTREKPVYYMPIPESRT